MKIVIDIDDDMYKSVANNYAYVLGDADLILLENAIANGTPLPEHHGRLIDEQSIIDRFKPIEKFEHWRIGLDGLFNVLSDAPTIIEGSDRE